MSVRYLVTFIFLISSFATFAQSKLSGKIVNDKNEPLAGVTITATGAGSTTTNIDGNFSLTLENGKKYSLTISAVGYATKSVNDVEVGTGQSNELNIVMAVAARDLGAVTVTSRSNARRESVNSLIQFQKNTNTVAQVVSAEFIRRSPDKSTGEVLKRVPGTSIQDGKYLIVRGLADRYNQAMLNGILLTSTEADRKTFSFDLFPAAVIDNIIINKAFVPELPGEWAGGLVQVNTKDIPARSFLQVQLGTGFNSQVIGKDFYRYKGGKYDWLGLDDKSRRLPLDLPLKTAFGQLSADQKTAYIKQFSSIWNAEAGQAPLNASFQLNGGLNTKLFGKKVGGILALNYSRSNKMTDFENRFYSINESQADINFDYFNKRYSQDVLWGALGNLTVQLNNNNKISLKQLFNINASDYTTLRTGVDYEADPINGQRIRAKELGFRSTIYTNTQLIGEHNLAASQTRLKWYGGFTILDQYVPDQRRIQYNQTGSDPSAPYQLLISNTLSQKSGSRFFSNLNDYIYNGGGDVAKSFNLFDRKQTVKVGYMLQVRDRLFDSRPFSIYLPKDNPQLRSLDESQVYNPENFCAAE